MKGYRTVIVNTLALVMPIFSMSEVTQILPVAYLPYYAIGLAVLNLVLRAITTTPVGQGR